MRTLNQHVNLCSLEAIVELDPQISEANGFCNRASTVFSRALTIVLLQSFKGLCVVKRSSRILQKGRVEVHLVPVC